MKKNKIKTLFIISGILLLIFSLFVLSYRAIEGSAPPSVPPLPTSDKEIITTGDVRTDVVVCYEMKNGEKGLINLSYQHSVSWLDNYPSDLLDEYDIQAGDFAEITYQAEYSIGGEDGHHQIIKQLGDITQIHAIEALSKRNLVETKDAFHLARTADSYPIRICQQKNADFVMVPAKEKYYLFLPDSDNPLIFDDYKEIKKEFNGKTLQAWVLCNDTVSDEQIFDTLLQGTAQQQKDFFFVGYASPYPIPFTANGFDQQGIFHMQKIFIPAEEPEEYYSHFTKEQLETPEIFTTLPVDVQHELITSWNHGEDVLIFGGDFDENTILSFNDNNQICAVSNTNYSKGYAVFYIEPAIFQNVCSGIAEAQSAT
ncbi:MAG: hypothetical protein IKI37_05745 [Oscillospiraceae bacterium]|nr:hypothetical protein [Oscillospiraceae bacterium]